MPSTSAQAETPSIFSNQCTELHWEAAIKADYSLDREEDLNQYKLDTITWSSGNQSESLTGRTINDVLKDETFRVRVIFAPLDESTKKVAKGFRRLRTHYSIPPDFLDGRLRSTVTSFGAYSKDAHSLSTWVRFLRKEVIPIADQKRLYDPQFYRDRGSRPFPQWRRASYFILWTKEKTELLVFGDAEGLKARFQQLPEQPKDVGHCASNPLALWTIVFDEIWHELDDAVESIRIVLGHPETTAVNSSDFGTMAHRPDFTDIVSLSKHIVYVREGLQAAISAVRGIMEEHELVRQDQPDSATWRNVHRKFQHLSRSLEGLTYRLSSFDARIQNLLQFSFHLSAQQDTSIMLHESHSMRTIAIVTIVFLPAATVSGICGTVFYYEEYGEVLGTSNQWILYAPIVILTLLTFSVYALASHIERLVESLAARLRNFRISTVR